MDFKDKINELENYNYSDNIIIKMGCIPILFSAPHTMWQKRKDGSIKYNEVYTKAIALYLNMICNTFSIIKINDTGMDSNKDNHDEYKKQLIEVVRKNNIKLVIDLHGAAGSRNFDVEFGTLNNLTADYSTVKELEDAFIENGIKNIQYNNPFKGGAITQYLYNLKDVDVIQLEINKKYRDNKNIEMLEKLVNSLINFIKQYSKYINKY